MICTAGVFHFILYSARCYSMTFPHQDLFTSSFCRASAKLLYSPTMWFLGETSCMMFLESLSFFGVGVGHLPSHPGNEAWSWSYTYIDMIIYKTYPFHRPVPYQTIFLRHPYLPRIRDAFLEHGCHADTRLWCVPWSIKLTVIERKNWSKLGKTCRTAGGDYWRLLYWTQMQRRVSALQRRRLLRWLRVVRVSPGGGRSNPAEVHPKAEEVTIGLLAWKIRHHTVIALEDWHFLSKLVIQ